MSLSARWRAVWGLAGEQIPVYARIVSVADTFDAMTSARPYRPALAESEALGELRRIGGSQLDPRLCAGAPGRPGQAQRRGVSGWIEAKAA